MPDFDIVKRNIIKEKSFRTAKVYDQFDLQKNEYEEKFTGKIIYPEEWNVGIIVGRSGTGKTTIAREVFGDYICNFKYKAASVIDDFPKKEKDDNIFKTLTSVGFSSPVSWLKPYNVLSNGQRMRVDLARALLLNQDIIIFDEYTSVVDREIAKIGALATQRTVRREQKRFIAVSCHYDIIDWLEPDWIFSTDEMKMLPRGSLQRPDIIIETRREKGKWNIFRKYHYLNHDINNGAHQWVGYINNKPVAFCSVLPLPHYKYKKFKRIHRVVVLPDYQGIGLGIKFLNNICDYYIKNEFRVSMVTSLNGFAKGLSHHGWILKRAGRVRKVKRDGTCSKMGNTCSSNRNTYSLIYSPKTQATP
jgi:ABC-type lipoprotein export system ATPase subunit/GNAT superfamily N-acetyltransferase